MKESRSRLPGSEFLFDSLSYLYIAHGAIEHEIRDPNRAAGIEILRRFHV